MSRAQLAALRSLLFYDLVAGAEALAEEAQAAAESPTDVAGDEVQGLVTQRIGNAHHVAPVHRGPRSDPERADVLALPPGG